MSSKSKSQTARLNGSKSKGPKTEAGKAASARNSLKHGLISSAVALLCEAPDEYDELRDAYVEQFQPDNQVEMDLVEALASTRFRLRRVVNIETHLVYNKFMEIDEDDTPEDPDQAMACVFELCLPSITLLTRYENSLNRTFDRTLKQLQLLQKSRLTPPIQKVRNEPKLAPGTQPLAPSGVEYKAVHTPCVKNSSTPRSLAPPSPLSPSPKRATPSTAPGTEIGAPQPPSGVPSSCS